VMTGYPILISGSTNSPGKLTYDFRGVEVGLVGTIRSRSGILQLTSNSLGRPVTLMPLQQDLKVQWHHQDRRVQDASGDELNAHM
jgi:hypothetical protein